MLLNRDTQRTLQLYNTALREEERGRETVYSQHWRPDTAQHSKFAQDVHMRTEVLDNNVELWDMKNYK